jgi:hypothetical protein
MNGRTRAAVAAGLGVLVALALWWPAHVHTIAMRQVLDQANRDTEAAKAAASSAADSAARAKASARNAWNGVPGGS